MSQKDQKKDTKEKKPRRFSFFTLAICICGALLVGFFAGNRVDELFISDNSLIPLKKTYMALKNNFDGKLDDKKLIEGASRGMVEAAGDPYTAYFSKEEAKQFANDLDGTFSGIGAELGKKNDKLVVISALDGNPAKKAGLMANDIIARVDGEDTTGWSIDKAVSKIRGKEGTTVKLTIVRNDDVSEVSIVRKTVTAPSVTTEEKGDIGVVRISRFDSNSADLARKAAEKFADKKGVVVDLRGNGGGYLEAAQEIASMWLKKDQVVVTERTGGKINKTHSASGDDILSGKPTVVLIDSGSASASEILAGALQDHKVATIVGVTSFGKGSVQQIVDLPNGAQLKVTVAKWYTPNGKNIGKHGITPNVKAEAGKNDDSDHDTQLDKALELLN